MHGLRAEGMSGPAVTDPTRTDADPPAGSATPEPSEARTPASPSPSPTPPPASVPPASVPPVSVASGSVSSSSRPQRVRLALEDAPRPLTSVVEPEMPDLGRRVALGGMAALVLLGIGLIVGSSSSSAPPVAAATPPSASASSASPSAIASAALSPNPLAEVDASAAAVSAPQVQRPPPVWRIASLAGEASTEIVEGTFGKNGLPAALAKLNVPKTEIKRLTQAFEGVKRVEHGLGPKDAFVLARDKAKGTIVAFELVTSPLDVWQARADEGDDKTGRLVAKKLVLFVEQRPLAAALTVTTDLAKAVAAANLHEDVLHLVDDAFEGHEDVQVRPGARLRLLGHEETVEGVFARTRLDAVELVPRSGKPLRVYWYERDPDAPGKRRAPAAGFYDAKAQQPFRGAFRSPLPMARVTSRFNPRRMHPVLKVVMPHNGIDYGAGVGTPVYASAAGTVISAGNNGPCGNMVEIEHAGGLHTAYCHLSRFAQGLHSGQTVEGRQLIGYVGQTGRATGPHLHFAVKRGTMFVDPLSLKMDGVRVLPPVDRDVFAKIRADLDAKLDGIPLPAATDVPQEPAPKDEEQDLHGE